MIRFPEVARPDVTVVMLTYNRWDLTKEALRLLAEVTEPRYEVVIVDNASTDGTLDELDRVEGARILRNPRNLGLRAGQQPGRRDGEGAISTAPQQRRVGQSGLARATDRGCGCRSGSRGGGTEARSTRTDGSRRPARSSGATGGFASTATATSRTGPSTTSAGRSTTPRRHAFSSAARHSSSVGGFDPRFAPVYYEDVDLCLALAAAAGRVVYQPRSVVEHVRGASSTGRRPGRSGRTQSPLAAGPLAVRSSIDARQRAGVPSRARSLADATR